MRKKKENVGPLRTRTNLIAALSNKYAGQALTPMVLDDILKDVAQNFIHGVATTGEGFLPCIGKVTVEHRPKRQVRNPRLGTMQWGKPKTLVRFRAKTEVKKQILDPKLKTESPFQDDEFVSLRASVTG